MTPDCELRAFEPFFTTKRGGGRHLAPACRAPTRWRPTMAAISTWEKTLAAAAW